MSASETVTQPSILLPAHTLAASCSSGSGTNLLKANIWDYSIEDICEIEKVALQLKSEEEKRSPLYLDYKQALENLHMVHLPFRSYAVWKKTPERSLPHYFDAFFLPYAKEKKESRQQLKKKLLELSKAPEVQERLKLLSRLTFIHGSSSSALAMMVLTGNFQLRCTGALLQDRIAPMCGELTVGIRVNGINLRNLSVETIRNIGRIKSYTGIAYFNPKWLENLFKPDHGSLLSESQWPRRGIELLQLKQWDFDSFVHRIVPLRETWMARIEEERKQQEKPMRELLTVIEHDFTAEEKEFLHRFFAAGLSSSSMEIPPSLEALCSLRSCAPFTQMTNNDFHIGLLRRQIGYYRKRNYDWGMLLHQILKAKIEGAPQDLLDESKPIFSQELSLIQKGYDRIVSELMSDELPALQIPADPKVRSLMTDPAPIIFSSTMITPKSSHLDPNPDEYLIDHPVVLGQKECNIMFTDTEESRERINALLPEHLRKEIEVRLFEELDVGEVPLIHAPFQIREP